MSTLFCIILTCRHTQLDNSFPIPSLLWQQHLEWSSGTIKSDEKYSTILVLIIIGAAAAARKLQSNLANLAQKSQTLHSVFFGRFLSGLGFKKIELFKKTIGILNYNAHGVTKIILKNNFKK
jgi:hypothetical protein